MLDNFKKKPFLPKKFYNKNYIAIELISADFTDENGNPADEARMNAKMNLAILKKAIDEYIN